MNQILLLGLGGNNFVKRPVLVEKKVRVPVAEDSGAFCRQHEELVSAIRNIECPTLVFPPVAQVPGRHNLLVTFFVRISRHVLITLLGELVRSVVAYGRQRLDNRFGRGWLRRSGQRPRLLGRRRNLLQLRGAYRLCRKLLVLLLGSRRKIWTLWNAGPFVLWRPSSLPSLRWFTCRTCRKVKKKLVASRSKPS